MKNKKSFIMFTSSLCHFFCCKLASLLVSFLNIWAETRSLLIVHKYRYVVLLDGNLIDCLFDCLKHNRMTSRLSAVNSHD